MEDKDLRDFFAAFAMLGLVQRNGPIEEIGEVSYDIADKLLSARSGVAEGGIVAIKRKKS